MPAGKLSRRRPNHRRPAFHHKDQSIVATYAGVSTQAGGLITVARK